MLKRIYRLGKPARLVGDRGYGGQFFNVRLARNGLLHNRYAFVVSKKVDKRAVIRNKLKRRLSACIEKMFSKIKTGYDIVFFTKKAAVFQTVENLCAEIESALKKEKLLE